MADASRSLSSSSPGPPSPESCGMVLSRTKRGHTCDRYRKMAEMPFENEAGRAPEIYGFHKARERGQCCRLSKRRSCRSLGHQMQVTGIGRVAAQPEGLAASRRGHLPRRRILQRRDECAAVWWRHLQRHFDKPVVDGRKRKLFGMKNPGDAWEPPVVAGRCLCRQRCADQ